MYNYTPLFCRKISFNSFPLPFLNNSNASNFSGGVDGRFVLTSSSPLIEALI